MNDLSVTPFSNVKKMWDDGVIVISENLGHLKQLSNKTHNQDQLRCRALLSEKGLEHMPFVEADPPITDRVTQLIWIENFLTKMSSVFKNRRLTLQNLVSDVLVLMDSLETDDGLDGAFLVHMLPTLKQWKFELHHLRANLMGSQWASPTSLIGLDVQRKGCEKRLWDDALSARLEKALQRAREDSVTYLRQSNEVSHLLERLLQGLQELKHHFDDYRVSLFIQKGLAARDSKRHSEAVVLFRKAFALQPDLWEKHPMLGLWCSLSKK